MKVAGLWVVIGVLSTVYCSGQTFRISRDSLNNYMRTSPSFTVYKDNYFIGGVPINQSSDKHNSNVKFQISFSQRLTNNVLPFNSHLFIAYSQKAFWNIFEKSRPFKEVNYNPSFGVMTPIFHRGEFRGGLTVMFEHESNGRDSTMSRSWNNISISYQTLFSNNWKASAKIWIPFYYYHNPSLIQYIGVAELSAMYDLSGNNRFLVQMGARKGLSWSWKGSLITDIFYKVSLRHNQYVGLQWYCGYSESLLDFDRFVNMVRFGIFIRPQFGTYY